ncbi:methylated-DNA--[protein]-cysteine S-methyltransferase [Solicola gregarius]|uniref:methylated-DNA--[protein]-cysteine S-methyltransferase n=1 Tax=Solicola gregarius TaxID=2908642 RepID=A0AA46YP37_9ACTN|nr:methylated-DNA--[protein]-cysteine S-methyltransferase [Solicola gregarius]UYM07243.1 methylated-DNA--[protein]-cysteine S-methyltransferase [Solicola gregarius]
MNTDDMLAALSRGEDETLRRLHARLADAAAADGLLDVAYRTIDSPVGRLLVAATERGLVRVAYVDQGSDAVLGELAERVSPRVLERPASLDTVARELDEYFGRVRTVFDLPLDLSLATGFRRNVITHLPDITYGSTATYADVARLVENPKAVRAVGTACATNPLPVVVPCHRVVRSDGTAGQYVGGAEAKRTLLDLEAAA